MSEAFIRTEDIDPKEVKRFFVETDNDRDIINSLKGHNLSFWWEVVVQERQCFCV